MPEPISVFVARPKSIETVDSLKLRQREVLQLLAEDRSIKGGDVLKVMTRTSVFSQIHHDEKARIQNERGTDPPRDRPRPGQRARGYFRPACQSFRLSVLTAAQRFSGPHHRLIAKSPFQQLFWRGVVVAMSCQPPDSLKSAHPAKILLVDDHPAVLQQIIRLLPQG